ncbi:MAG: hypothetical protein ACR2F6_08195 [Mycobacteriales bacterium]
MEPLLGLGDKFKVQSVSQERVDQFAEREMAYAHTASDSVTDAGSGEHSPSIPVAGVKEPVAVVEEFGSVNVSPSDG